MHNKMSYTIMHNQRAQDWMLGALAVALFASPWLPDFQGHQAEWSAWIAAIALAYFASAALFDASLFKSAQWEEWATALVGIWLILAPELLHFNQYHLAQWVHWLIGALTLLVSLWAEWSHRHPDPVPRH